jgi:hypothetical protein
VQTYINFTGRREEIGGLTSVLSMGRVKATGPCVFAPFSFLLLLARHSSVARTGTPTAKTHAPTSFIGDTYKFQKHVGMLKPGSSQSLENCCLKNLSWRKERREAGEDFRTSDMIVLLTGPAYTVTVKQ